MENKVLFKGVMDLGGMQIPCYVLDNGVRVLSGRGMQESLKMVEADEGRKTSGTRLVRYLNQKSLKPFISKYLGVDHFVPLKCMDGGHVIYGYRAEALADICDAFLEARKNIQLSPRQEVIASQCETLMRAFARVGIIALVDEATGYQYSREREELQKILQLYISDKLLPWQKRFPDVFYKELFRLNGWDYSVNGIIKRPSVIGKWTNRIIYEELPNGVLEELKKRTPKNTQGNRLERYHQHLTTDIGEPNLERQINKVVTLFLISDNMEQFWYNFQKVKAREQGQLDLPFGFDEKGHTKE